MVEKDIVRIERKARKRFKKLPKYILAVLNEWVDLVEEQGIRETRKRKGYHDEPLQGKRKGQRSIRLSKHWRAIYREEKDGTINLIIVEEVHKHDY